MTTNILSYKARLELLSSALELEQQQQRQMSTVILAALLNDLAPEQYSNIIALVEKMLLTDQRKKVIRWLRKANINSDDLTPEMLQDIKDIWGIEL